MEYEKVCRGQVQWIRWLWHTIIDVWTGALLWCQIHDLFFYNSLCISNKLLLHIMSIMALLFNRTAFWQEFMMHHVVAIEGNSEQIWRAYYSLVSSERFPWDDWTLVSISQQYIHNLALVMRFVSKSESSLKTFNSSWMIFMQSGFCLNFSNFEIIFVAGCFMPKTSIKIGWHELNDMLTASAIIQNQSLHCFNISIGCWRTRATRKSIVI